jgi:signal transduction histidine kinase
VQVQVQVPLAEINQATPLEVSRMTFVAAEWKRFLPWLRILLGAAAVACALTAQPRSSLWAVGVVAGFLAFGLFVILRRRAITGPLTLLILFVDALFFLVLAATGIGWFFRLPALCYLYVMAESVAFYNPQEVLVVMAVTATSYAVMATRDSPSLKLTAAVAAALAYGFSVYKKQLQSRIEDLARAVTESREQAARSREDERQRIANDFHDGPLQSFISLQMRLQILRKLLERDVSAGMADLEELQALAQQQVKELRAFVRSMRPLDLRDANLFASLRRLCENFQKESGIPVTFMGADNPLKLPEETASELIQMLREALHNVLKHAGATRVAVSAERAGKTLEIAVDDNGGGFRFSGIYTLDELELLRLGPASLKRRARAINAEMMIESRPGRGAGLKLRVPIP